MSWIEEGIRKTIAEQQMKSNAEGHSENVQRQNAWAEIRAWNAEIRRLDSEEVRRIMENLESIGARDLLRDVGLNLGNVRLYEQSSEPKVVYDAEFDHGPKLGRSKNRAAFGLVKIDTIKDVVKEWPETSGESWAGDSDSLGGGGSSPAQPPRTVRNTKHVSTRMYIGGERDSIYVGWGQGTLEQRSVWYHEKGLSGSFRRAISRQNAKALIGTYYSYQGNNYGKNNGSIESRDSNSYSWENNRIDRPRPESTMPEILDPYDESFGFNFDFEWNGGRSLSLPVSPNAIKQTIIEFMLQLKRPEEVR